MVRPELSDAAVPGFLKQGDGFTEQKMEPAPIDEANAVTFPVDPAVKAKAGGGNTPGVGLPSTLRIPPAPVATGLAPGPSFIVQPSVLTGEAS